MTLFRVLKRLEMGSKLIPVGELIPERNFKPGVVKRLLVVGALAEVYAPPLRELPGLSDASDQLALAGIEMADQLLECDIDTIATTLNVPRETVVDWRVSAARWLIIEEEPRHG